MPPWANPLQTWWLGAGRKGSEKVNSERNGPIRRLAGRSVVKVFAPDAYHREYEFHPGSKCADPDGLACTRQTIGLLQRRHVRIAYVVPIGKESNSLEDVESGLIHSEPNVYTVYPDPQCEEWEMRIRPALRKMALEQIEKLSGMSRRAVVDIRAGKRGRIERIAKSLCPF